MNYSYYDLGNLKKGQVVEVTLSSAANVCLLTPSDFTNYKNRRPFNYYGGKITQSPYPIRIPFSGHWYLTIDLGGYSGTVSHDIQILPGYLSEA